MQILRLLLLYILLPISAAAQSVSLSSSNLPIIVINTNGQVIADEPKITADMGIIFNPGGARNQLSDPFNHYNGKIGIEVRGQSSQGFPMKSYTVELRDATGLDIDRSLLGMPAESDWVLYAPYTDKTLMRNFLAYTLARSMGRWAANCRHVEVIINGEYKGVYILMEKIKRGSDRVNIARLTTTDISGDALTGGYIFSLDKQPNGWTSSYQVPNATNSGKRVFSYVYPELADILPVQKDYIKSAVDAFEASLASPRFQDPFIGVRKYADIGSFIDYFLVNEISRNVDGYRLSSYFYKDKNSKNPRIFAGPAWDYDLAFRNADYCNGFYISGWAYMFNYVCPGDGAGLIPFWWEKLMNEDTAFQSDLRCRWKTLQKSVINMGWFTKTIDSVTSLLDEAQQRHFMRWPILGKYVWPNPQPLANTYAQEIEYLKTWLGARLDWINSSLPNAGNCYDYPPEVSESVIVRVLPNPIASQGVIEVKSRYNQDLAFVVVDMMGRIVASRQTILRPGVNTIPLQAETWARGVYLIRMQTSNGEKILQKIIK